MTFFWIALGFVGGTVFTLFLVNELDVRARAVRASRRELDLTVAAARGELNVGKRPPLTREEHAGVTVIRLPDNDQWSVRS